MQSIGFKEWALVCQALGSGRQTVIIRKGGIAEGRDGFAFRQRDFFLFPTYFHEQIERVRLPEAKIPEPLAGEIEIRYAAAVQAVRVMTDWAEVRALAPFHILDESVVRERFDYDEARGVHVAFVRVFALNPIWRFPDWKRYAGCRSWVELPPVPAEMKFERVKQDG